jgi:hypothetical protein
MTAFGESCRRCGHVLTARFDPGCVKTLRGITAPRISRLVVTLRAKKRKNSSSARRYDQIRFRFHTAWNHSGHGRTNYGAAQQSVVDSRNERCGTSPLYL